MFREIKGRLGRIVGQSPLGLLPVRVQQGPAKGAHWTLAPFSYYWRKGGYEGDVPAALKLFPSAEGLVFWDIGAHFGIHTITLAMLVGSGGQVAAFEPDRGAFERLTRHVQMNSLSNVQLYQAAASNEDGEDELFIRGYYGSAVSHLRYDSSDNMTGVPSTPVRKLRVDTLVAAGKIRPPDIIKVDAQGHGGYALEGAATTIASYLPVIAFSNHSPGELSHTRDLLAPLGYQPHDFTNRPIGWDEFNEAVLAPPHRTVPAYSV